MRRQIPVTVITGAAGFDGTTVLKRLLSSDGDTRLSAIVPKRSRKKKRSGRDPSVIPTTEHLVRLGQGCSCCTVRGDVMTKVHRIAEDQSADHILIQATPQADLRTLAKTFTVPDGQGVVLADFAQIGSLVTVVDLASFLDVLGGSGARALVERIELCNVVLAQGSSDVSSERTEQALAAIKALNSDAVVVMDNDTDLAVSALSAAVPFDLNQAEQRAAGTDGMNGTAGFSFEARRPFHPARLHALLAERWTGLLRAKGMFWIASRPDLACSLDVAGSSQLTTADGMWWATVSEHERSARPDLKRYFETIWHPEFGDRHQSINIIGVGLDVAALQAKFDAALLTDDELSTPEQWPTMTDPFPWKNPND